MATESTHDELSTLRRAASGDAASWQAVLGEHRDRLRKLAVFRLDRRLQSRLDASDVVQDVFAEASRRLDDYLTKPSVPFFLWLRALACQQVVSLHRRHLGAERRDVRKDVSIDQAELDSSTAMAAHLAGDQTSPSEAALRGEKANSVRDALAQMDPMDREVLALRHFEGLSNAEVAEVLSLSISAASKRYIRAAERLRTIMNDLSVQSESAPVTP